MKGRTLLAVGALALVLVGCGGAAAKPATGPTATPSASPTASSTAATESPSPSPTNCAFYSLPGLCAGRPATSAEVAAMVAVGKPAAERDLHAPDTKTCSASQPCFTVKNPARGMVGTNAGTFDGSLGCSAAAPCGGASCWVFLYQDAAGWHYVNVRCAQAAGNIPGPQDLIKVSGCANVRDAPGLSAHVVACLANGTVVDVDSAPVYLDGHIWWHLSGRGWMAHEYLT